MIVRALWIRACVAVAALLVAGSAQAFPIVFNGPGGFGISAALAYGAEADGVPIIAVESIATAASLNLTIPAPDVLSFQLVSRPSVSNPNRATSEWSVTNSGAGSLSNAWLVYLDLVTYTATRVGFEIDGEDGWAVISVFVPDGEDGSYYFYPARYLGNMDASDTVDFLMHHLVGQALHPQGGELVLPQYSVGALVGIPVPEPQQLVLLALGIVLTATLRRRSA